MSMCTAAAGLVAAEPAPANCHPVPHPIDDRADEPVCMVGTGVGRPVTWRPLRWTGFPVPRDVREEADTGRRGGRRIARTTERILLLLEYKKKKDFLDSRLD